MSAQIYSIQPHVIAVYDWLKFLGSIIKIINK